MNAVTFENRREKLRRILHRQELGALLVSLDANRYYLSGFELLDHQKNETAGYLVITAAGPDWLCTDARYHTAACRIWDENHVFIYGGDSAAQLAELLQTRCSGPIGFESSLMSVQLYTTLSENLDLQPADGLVEELRIRKEPEEIERLRRSAALNHSLMEWVPSRLAAHVSETQLAWEIECFFRERGASALSFPSIVAVGPNAALPHASPGDARLREDSCLLIDTGCRLDDYCSDQTRTFWVGGKPPEYFLTCLNQVRDAQQAAIDLIRPGVPVSAVYHAARDYFMNYDVARYFTHSLGHGIGLQTHEAPSLSPRSDLPLEAGMVVTVEPGLYYPQWGGVRWEYMVLVTEDGAEVL